MNKFANLGAPMYVVLKTPKKLSIEEANKIILEKVPIEERLKSVYHPMIAMDCSLYILRECLAQIRNMGLSKTKKPYRELMECDKNYCNDNYRAMQPTLFKNFTEKTMELYKIWGTDFIIFRLQYSQALLNDNIEVNQQVAMIAALACVVKRINMYVVSLDRSFSNRISELLGKGITYQTSDNRYSLRIIKAVDDLLEVLGVPYIETTHTELAMKVLDVKLKDTNIWE